jgi:hypothetical protein
VVFHTAVHRGEEVQGSWADVLHPKTRKQLQAAVREAELELIGLYGDFSKTPYDPKNSPALIMVGRK